MQILERAFGAEHVDDIRHSPKIVVWWTFLLVWVIAGIRFATEDVQVTDLGYRMLPTRSPFLDTGFWVAIFLFILPVVCTIVYIMTNKAGWWYLSGFSLLVDLLFDTTYRVVSDPLLNPAAWSVEVVIALIQGVFIFTLGSEVALAVGIPLLIELMPDMMHQLLHILTRIFTFGQGLMGEMDEEEYIVGS